MMDDDDEVNEEMDRSESEFLDWYDNNYYYFRDLGAFPPVDAELFYQNVYCPVMAAFYPAVRQLANEHYPLIANEKRPELLDGLTNSAKLIGRSLLPQLYMLLRHVRLGNDLRKAYPDFEKMSERVKDVQIIRKEIFDAVEGLTQLQKQQLYRLALDNFKDSYNFKDQRTYEFMNIVSPIVLEHCPSMFDFSNDAWVVYSYMLKIEHAEFRLEFEFYHSFIDCNLPIADLKLTSKEIHEKVQQILTERLRSRW